MKKIIHLLVFVFIGFSINVHAESPVWKVSHGDNHLYLGGTIHLLGKDDYPLPPAFEKAYQDSSKLVFEADIQKFQSPDQSQLPCHHRAWQPALFR